MLSTDVVRFISPTFAAKFVRLAPAGGILSWSKGRPGLGRSQLCRVMDNDIDDRAEVLVTDGNRFTFKPGSMRPNSSQTQQSAM